MKKENVKYVVGVLKYNGCEVCLHDIKTIRTQEVPTLENVIKLYTLLTGHSGVKYPIQVICKIDNGVIDIYDDAAYYVDNDPAIMDFIKAM